MTTQTNGGTRTHVLLSPRILNIVAFAVVLVFNTLATTGAIGGVTTGELSDAFPSLFTPAGYVFSIWGLIYSLLIVFVVYQALPAQRNNPRLERLGYLFVLSCLFNSAWIVVWQFQQIALSWVLMLGILVTLILIYQRLGIGTSKVGRVEDFALRLPFRIYLGWITVATVANTSILLLDLGVTGGAWAPLWAIVAITAAVGIGYLVLRRRDDIAFNLVLVWAFVGIAMQQWGAQLPVVVAALVAAGLVAAAVLRAAQLRFVARRLSS